MRFVLALCLALSLPLVSIAPGVAQDLPDSRIREIARSALSELPSLSVAVGRDGEVLWADAFGLASLDPERASTSSTRYRVYSVSKPWTAAAGLRLAGAGRLDPNAPIDVAGFPDKGAPITAYELATHTAGIRHYRDGEAVMDRECDTVDEAVAIFAEDSLRFAPGTDRAYSTWGYVLLGAVLEDAAGAPFDAVLRRQVLDPAGMTATVHAGDAADGSAAAYERGPDGGFRDVTGTTDPSCKWGGGGYLSTAADLARFPLAVLSGRLLPPSAAGLLFEDEASPHRTGGSGPGGTAHVRTDLESGLVVALATNVGGALGTIADLADRIAKAAEPAAEASPMDRLARRLAERVPAWLEETGEPGLAVALVEDCRIVGTMTWGVADRRSDRPVEAGTVFNVGSISKTLTAWGVMRLAEEGAIDLDAPVGRYLQKWKPAGGGFDPEGVTVRRLLSHTGGINVPSVSGVGPGEPLPSLLDELERGRPALGIEPVRIASEPGSAFAYSGGGYLILQRMIEEVTGRPFAEWMEEAVLDPLGMESSAYGLDPVLEARAATPYAVDGSAYALRRFPGLAAAGLWSTADDMARFVAAHCVSPKGEKPGRDVISPEALRTMWTPSPPAERYGLGYQVFPPLGDHAVVAHSGSNFGWKADFIVFPDLGTGIVALSNVDEGKTRMAALEAFREAMVTAAKSGVLGTARRPDRGDTESGAGDRAARPRVAPRAAPDTAAASPR